MPTTKSVGIEQLTMNNCSCLWTKKVHYTGQSTSCENDSQDLTSYYKVPKLGTDPGKEQRTSRDKNKGHAKSHPGTMSPTIGSSMSDRQHWHTTVPSSTCTVWKLAISLWLLVCAPPTCTHCCATPTCTVAASPMCTNHSSICTPVATWDMLIFFFLMVRIVSIFCHYNIFTYEINNGKHYLWHTKS